MVLACTARTPPPSTSARVRWCGSGSTGPRRAEPDLSPLDDRRRRVGRRPRARRPGPARGRHRGRHPHRAGHGQGPAGAAGAPRRRASRRSSTCSASPGRRRPIGSSAACGRRWRWWCPAAGRCSSAAARTTRCGPGSAGPVATTGSRWRTAGPSPLCRRRAATDCRARTSPTRSASGPTSWWWSLSRPRDGHCYKTVAAMLPRP